MDATMKHITGPHLLGDLRTDNIKGEGFIVQVESMDFKRRSGVADSFAHRLDYGCIVKCEKIRAAEVEETAVAAQDVGSLVSQATIDAPAFHKVFLQNGGAEFGRQFDEVVSGSLESLAQAAQPFAAQAVLLVASDQPVGVN